MSNVDLALVLMIPHQLHLTMWLLSFCDRDYEAGQLPHSTNLLFLHYHELYFYAGMVPRYIPFPLPKPLFPWEGNMRKQTTRVIQWSGQVTKLDLNGTSALGRWCFALLFCARQQMMLTNPPAFSLLSEHLQPNVVWEIFLLTLKLISKEDSNFL